MYDSNLPSTPRANRPAWNKGKLTGPKPPQRPGHVWLIRAKLQLERRTRDLALFNLAIDSKLRGCDLVALCVDDVAPNGYAVDRANVRQRKTGRPVRDGEWAERGEITLEAAAKIVGVCNMTALRMLRRGDIKGGQVCPGAPWVIKAADLTNYWSEAI